jgi:hypothetical protein
VYHRVPPEIWEQIALQTPKYHLRKWLFVSRFHRDIPSRHIFRPVHIYFGENDSLIRRLDIFDRAKRDPIFGSRVKSLRLHWDFEKGNTLDLMIRMWFGFSIRCQFTDIFGADLPAFKRDFKWIGHPELQEEMVQNLLNTHKHLHGLGLM